MIKILGFSIVSAIAMLPATVGAASRTDVPITLQVIKPDADKRVWSIPVTYGSTTVQTVLDTGSIPPQVLPDQLKATDSMATGATYHYGYGFGGMYKGNVVAGTVAVGTLSAPIKYGVVSSAMCASSVPNCDIAGEPPNKARFGGNTYNAIMGAELAMGTVFAPAFFQLGAHRFLITAPRLNPVERVGHLILNPTTNETSGFVSLTLSTATDVDAGSVRGCLGDKTRSINVCGTVFFDSGNTGITLFPAQKTEAFGAGDAAQLEFTDGYGGQLAGVDFTVGRTAAEKVSVAAPGQYAETFIRVGQLPYLGLDILTDFDRGGYGVRARPAQGDGTVGHVP